MKDDFEHCLGLVMSHSYFNIIDSEFPEFYGLFVETLIPHFEVYGKLFNLHSVQSCDKAC